MASLVDFVATEWGYTWEQAYVIVSVAGVLRIGEVVNSPNALVYAAVPTGIFE